MKKFFLSLAFLLLKFLFLANSLNIQSQNIENDEKDDNLLLAVYENNFKKVDSLLIEGANPNAISFEKIPALHYAIYNNNLEIISLLVDSGANIENTDKFGLTSLNLSAKLGIDTVMFFFIMNGAKIDTTDFSGLTPLHNAVYSGNYIAVDMLLFYGANTETINKKNKTPLISAIETGNYEITYNLLNKGANPNFYNSNIDPAVFTAIKFLDIEILKLLKQFDANLLFKNNDNLNILETALMTKNFALVEEVIKISNLKVTEISNEESIWNDFFQARDRKELNSLKELGLKRPNNLIFGGIYFNQNFKFSNNDFYSITGFGARELNYNFGVNLSFGTRFTTKRTRVQKDENTIYILNSFRYFYQAGLDKSFFLLNFKNKSSLSLIMNYSLLYINDIHRNVSLTDKHYFSHTLSTGFKFGFNKNQNELILMYNYSNFKSLIFEPHFIKIGFSTKLSKR